MKIQELLDWFANHANLVLSYFIIVFAISLIGLLFVNQKNFKPPVSYFYSVLVYATAIPGILGLILLLYRFFFLKNNLLQIDIVTHFVPLISAILILAVINKTIPMSIVPGFGKLSGLLIIVLVTFIVTYVLQRMFFGVFFVGKLQYLALFFLLLLVGLKVAWNKIVK